ncbi:uncharacterized protein LOC117111750 [Anneissia japonica]|uniref:uncharacterized protein LOC117111750 n=1 Tax=Anneissia japonica TaxID=1529436 RepID=UPI001425833C|nr:uncharacterized protein LOC117111750 [Anneissia japonica]
MHMYRVAKISTKNGVDIPYYTCIRGNNSLEGFHSHLPKMIPGPHCAAHPFQVYLISGIARWNADRQSQSVFGRKGRHHRAYSSSLVQRLNMRCQKLFGESEEENFRTPAQATSELLGLDYLFNQSSDPTTRENLQSDGPSMEEEVTNIIDDGADDGGYDSDSCSF